MLGNLTHSHCRVPKSSKIRQCGRWPVHIPDPRVRRLRFDSAEGESCDLLPVGSDPVARVTYFAALLPWTPTNEGCW
jgi:hypothetical protein